MPPCFHKINEIIDYITVHKNELRHSEADLSAWLVERRRLRIWTEKTGIAITENEDHIMPERVVNYIAGIFEEHLPKVFDEALASTIEAVENPPSLMQRARDKFDKKVLFPLYVSPLRWLSHTEMVMQSTTSLYKVTSAAGSTFSGDEKEENWEEWEGVQECAFEKEDAAARFPVPKPRGEQGKLSEGRDGAGKAEE